MCVVTLGDQAVAGEGGICNIELQVRLPTPAGAAQVQTAAQGIPISCGCIAGEFGVADAAGRTPQYQARAHKIGRRGDSILGDLQLRGIQRTDALIVPTPLDLIAAVTGIAGQSDIVQSDRGVLYADGATVGTVDGIFCVVVPVAAESAVQDGQLGVFPLALDGNRCPARSAGGTGTGQCDGIVRKGGTGDGQALLGAQIGCHSTDDGIIAVSGEGVVLEVNTGDHHVFVSIYSYTCHAGSGIFPSRHAAVEGGAISLNRDQGCRWIGIALFNSHIADRSAWIKIDDAGVFGTTFQRAARQRDSAFISEEAAPCNLVDGDLDAFVDIDVAVIKDQIVERGILLISSILNGCGRPCCPVFDGQRHFRNFKLRRVTGGSIPGNKRVAVPVGVSTIQSNIYCCIYTGTRCWSIIVKIDISINSNSRFSRFIKGNNSISSGKESILCFYMKISINFYDAIRHGNNSAVCCFDISIFCIYCYASAFIDRNSITIC